MQHGGLAEPFVPRPTSRRRNNSGNGQPSASPATTLYYSPSNPFCPLSPSQRVPTPHWTVPRTARRLDFDTEQAEPPDDEDDGRRACAVVMEMALMLVFGILLVVFISSLGGFDRRAAGVEEGGRRAWHLSGMHRDLEGIWDAARPPR